MSGVSVAPADLTGTELRRAIAGTLLPGFLGTTLPDWLAERLRGGLGGVCLFGQNIVSAGQLRRLTDAIRAANPDAVVAIDEEGGDVTRLYYGSGSPYPGNAILGRLGDTAYTEQVARRVGEELCRAGVNLDFAPDIDINSNPDNPVIGVRSFGSSPSVVADHGAAWTRGLQAAGVAVAAKHFPGHGDTATDSHLALPVVDLSAQQLRERELVPFRAVIDAGARAVMTSHILLPQLDAALPATLSPAVLDGMLRGELGFDGVVVSDALDMEGASGGGRGIPEAAVLALAAGCDLLCLGTENTDDELAAIEEAVVAAVSSGRLAPSRLAVASARVLSLTRTAPPTIESAQTDGSHGVSRAISADSTVGREAELVRSAFEVSPRAEAWLADYRGGRYSVVRIETVANLAVGTAPWGPFSAVDAEPDAAWAKAFAANPAVVFTENDHPDLVLAAQSPVLVIGKDNHRHAFARAAIDRLRAERERVLVVDMGWPGDDRAYADIATFGASRLVGRALLELLGPVS
ncbi:MULTISPECIES: glycoside hydrolase family 3 N-terminal domain-containing protein [unclassified Leifsonia]|uniref:glycoside hydrolase family 3 protein n=1 Tax=unclassified Leifsonia TaxID=2663824 RepID=UPI0008A75212|nr:MULTISPECIES: glycoside hydrolase family 3 N-terminal domain-containing protein [unclassified Leifsonia]SEI12970.1 beta-N-acetylhexosaminidase [Leifsonia sp. CL154]SFL96068.1 beta-N-acetylhexosaminidase [Leifsonia sp. CL147]